MNQSWRRDYLRYKSYFLNVMGQYKERADVRAYLEILLSLATISIFAVFALRPTLLTIAELLKEIETKKSTLAKMDAKISNLSSAQILFDQQRENVELLNVAIPSNPNPDVFARQVEGLAARYSTPVSKITLGKTVILGPPIPRVESTKKIDPFPEGASELPYSVTTTVPIEEYPSISGFLNDVEQLRIPAKIDKMIINAVKEDNKSLLIFVIEGRLPYYQESTPEEVPENTGVEEGVKEEGSE